MMIRAIACAALAGVMTWPAVAQAYGPDNPVGFGLGPRAGYYKAADADEGNWTGGLQARLRLLPFLGVEGSVDYRQDDFANETVRVRSYPVMLSGLLYFFPNPVLSPYLLAGVGWHYTDVDFRGALSGVEDRTSSEFGGQLGGGADLPIGERVTLDADIRYIFLNFDDEIRNRAATDIDADSLAVTLGLTFYF